MNVSIYNYYHLSFTQGNFESLLNVSETYTPPHTHTLESKVTKNSTLECKENDQKLRISHVKNVNKRKNPLTPVKLESKKQDKKVLVIKK